MGLDLYAGPLTRYYAGQWKTVIGHAAEHSHAVAPDAQSMVTNWQQALHERFPETFPTPPVWNESADAPYRSDKPGWDPWCALVLWAAYDQNPQLTAPTTFSGDKTSDDPAFSAMSDSPPSDCRYPHLALGAVVWLPLDFPLPGATKGPRGIDMGIGSLPRLIRELDALNARTWRADAAQLKAWSFDGPPDVVRGRAPLEPAARFAFALTTRLAAFAAEHTVPLRLDW